MAGKASIFKKIATSRASKGGNHIKDGKYRFLVKKVLQEKKEDGEMFIVELQVVTSENVPGQFEKAGKPVWPGIEGAVEVKANPVGSSPSYVLNLDSNKSAGNNAKAFVLALYDGEDFDEEDEEAVADFVETVDELVGEMQPARGMLIDDETFRKKIKGGKNAGEPFVGHNWTHVPQTPEEIAQRRAKLDKTDREEAAKSA